jgi:hypothetical protein
MNNILHNTDLCTETSIKDILNLGNLHIRTQYPYIMTNIINQILNSCGSDINQIIINLLQIIDLDFIINSLPINTKIKIIKALQKDELTDKLTCQVLQEI